MSPTPNTTFFRAAARFGHFWQTNARARNPAIAASLASGDNAGAARISAGPPSSDANPACSGAGPAGAGAGGDGLAAAETGRGVRPGGVGFVRGGRPGDDLGAGAAARVG